MSLIFTRKHSLEDAKDWLRSQLDSGARCPCCSQYTKMYRRRLHSNMARMLIAFYRLGLDDFVHVKDIVARTGLSDYRCGEWAKMKLWGLIEEMPKSDGGDKKTSGFWRVTDAGRRFVGRRSTIYSHVKVFDGRFFGFSGDPVYIDECLGKKFSYGELVESGDGEKSGQKTIPRN